MDSSLNADGLAGNTSSGTYIPVYKGGYLYKAERASQRYTWSAFLLCRIVSNGHCKFSVIDCWAKLLKHLKKYCEQVHKYIQTLTRLLYYLPSENQIKCFKQWDLHICRSLCISGIDNLQWSRASSYESRHEDVWQAKMCQSSVPILSLAGMA